LGNGLVNKKRPTGHRWGAGKANSGKHNYQMTLLVPFCFLAFFRVMVVLEFFLMGGQFSKWVDDCQPGF
jgi:hypothetical protein